MPRLCEVQVDPCASAELGFRLRLRDAVLAGIFWMAAANAREVKTRGQVRRRGLSEQASAEDEGGGGRRARAWRRWATCKASSDCCSSFFGPLAYAGARPFSLNSSPLFAPVLHVSSRVRFTHRYPQYFACAGEPPPVVSLHDRLASTAGCRPRRSRHGAQTVHQADRSDLRSRHAVLLLRESTRVYVAKLHR